MPTCGAGGAAAHRERRTAAPHLAHLMHPHRAAHQQVSSLPQNASLGGQTITVLAQEGDCLPRHPQPSIHGGGSGGGGFLLPHLVLQAARRGRGEQRWSREEMRSAGCFIETRALDGRSSVRHVCGGSNGGGAAARPIPAGQPLTCAAASMALPDDAPSLLLVLQGPAARRLVEREARPGRGLLTRSCLPAALDAPARAAQPHGNAPAASGSATLTLVQRSPLLCRSHLKPLRSESNWLARAEASRTSP